MILQALVKHYETLEEQGEVPKEGWCKAKVSYALDISEDGKLLGIIPLKHEEPRGQKKVWVPTLIEVPQMVARSSGVSANFLCDNSKYMLGIDKEGTGKRIRECFEAAKEKHLKILADVHNETANAIKNFFLMWEPELAKENVEVAEKWEELTDGGNLILYAGGFAQENEEIVEAWEKERQNADTDEIKVFGTCLVTGEKAEISRIHNTIRGIQGAQSSGAALVSFNAPAFESYGKEQSYNAPVGKYAAFAYTTALNYLITQEKYVFRLGDTTVVFWAESGKEIYQQAFMDFVEPQMNLLFPQLDDKETIKGIFENLRKGRPVDIEGIQLNPAEEFYILGLAPNAARLSVRFFYQNSFGEILSNLQEHYKRMEIVKPVRDTREDLGIWEMLRETANQKSKDKKPSSNMAAATFQAVLSGGRYPESLYSNVLIRIRAEQGAVTRGRAAIIKAYLIRNSDNRWIKEELFVGLNEKCNNIAYVLGREFAVLEAVQKEANGETNTTIKDRYFNAACATPSSVFPILIKLGNSHLRKIGKEKKGLKIYYEKLFTTLQGKITVTEEVVTAYPKQLSLDEQGVFGLGYYHQVQKFYEKKEDK